MLTIVKLATIVEADWREGRTNVHYRASPSGKFK